MQSDDARREAPNGRYTRRSRRDFLAGASAALVGAVAGCSALVSDGPNGPRDDREYGRLQVTAVYVADGVDLSMPDEVETVTGPSNADLLVLPGGTDARAEQVVDWLADDRTLALLGDGAESTWLSWARSDTYRDTFDGGGYGDSDPDPQLLVAAAVGLDVTTYRHTWGDGPRDRDVLDALDEVLVDVATRTPR